MVRQVQVVAILMIVNGALVSLMGLLYICLGPAMFALMKLGPAGTGPGGRPNPAGPSTAEATFLSAFYVVIGLPVLAAGILNIVAGIRSLKYRGRILALVALFSNLAPLFTCYCLPTSLGVMIYGLIVFFQSDVADAFARVADGLPPERIKYGWRDEDEADDEFPEPPIDRRRRGDNIQRGPEDTYR
jgi:hypothetical protein